MADDENERPLHPEILKQSKPITDLKKGDNVLINGAEVVVDNQIVFQEHKGSNEMIIEVYNPKNEREYQIRYFDDQIDSSIEVYELQGDFQYVRREPKTIEW